KAELIGADKKLDLALLKINTDRKLKAVKFGDSDKLRSGDWVMAIGNPFSLGGSVTAGIISAQYRDINSGPYDNYLQTDAAMPAVLYSISMARLSESSRQSLLLPAVRLVSVLRCHPTPRSRQSIS